MRNVLDRIKKVDIFGDTIGFTMKGGSPTFTTCLGAVITICIYMLVLIYGQNKFLTMIFREDTSHQTIVNKDAISNEELITLSSEEFKINFQLV